MRGPDGEGVVGVNRESHLSRWAGRMMTCNVTSLMFISLCHSEFDILTCTPILGFQSMIMQVHDYGGLYCRHRYEDYRETFDLVAGDSYIAGSVNP
jgi:hypothetical protein